ncbi:MAG: (d)CMP kinase [Acidimicrobiia bacterium]
MGAVVAIDGPSGSGKSSVARAVATDLGLDVLDTGAMYRAVTLAALEAGLDLGDAGTLTDLAGRSRIEIDPSGRVTLDERDVTREIRGPDVTAAVSTVSAHPGVRTAMVERQREWVARRRGGVVEGRDIGTVVFPEATLKVFLDARDAERARRRHRDEEAADRDVDVDAVRESLKTRDAKDSSRVVAPLRAAAGALVIDTTGRSVAEVTREIVSRVQAASGE